MRRWADRPRQPFEEAADKPFTDLRIVFARSEAARLLVRDLTPSTKPYVFPNRLDPCDSRRVAARAWSATAFKRDYKRAKVSPRHRQDVDRLVSGVVDLLVADQDLPCASAGVTDC